MKNRILAVVALSVLTIGPAGAEDIRSLFINMPDTIMPALTRSERLDFLDYMDSGMRARVNNKLGGESTMTAFSDRMLTVMTSRSARMDMVLFSRKDGSNLICLIRTVTARYDDSSIMFYNEDWTPVETKSLIKLPRFDDYLTKAALKQDSIDAFRRKSILRLQSVSAVDDCLEFRYTSLDYIGEDAERYRSWLKPEPLRYLWNGKKFKRK